MVEFITTCFISIHRFSWSEQYGWKLHVELRNHDLRIRRLWVRISPGVPFMQGFVTSIPPDMGASSLPKWQVRFFLVQF